MLPFDLFFNPQSKSSKPMGRAYKLASAAIASTNASASVRVTQSTKIKNIFFDLSCLAGAGVSRVTYEVSKQNVNSLAMNDTPDTVLCSCTLPVTNGVHTSMQQAVLCDIPISTGDTIYVNVLVTGAVPPANASACIYLYT